MAKYRFELGQEVRFRNRRGFSQAGFETFVITAFLPMQGGSCRYGVCGVGDDVERVADEDDLEPANAPAMLAANNNHPGFDRPR